MTNGPTADRAADLTRVLGPRDAAHLGATLYLGAAIVFTLGTAAYVLAEHFVLPFRDHWTWLARFYVQGLRTTLWAQAGEHRLVIPGLFYYVDLAAFSGRGTFLTASLLAAQLGGALCLAAPFWRRGVVSRPAAFVFTGFSLVLMVWLIQGVTAYAILGGGRSACPLRG